MPCVRIEPICAEVRIYLADAPDWDAPHDISLMVRWRPGEPGAADTGLHSAVRPHTRATLRALMAALMQAGVRIVYAHRREGHRLPGAVMTASGDWRLDLQALAARTEAAAQ